MSYYRQDPFRSHGGGVTIGVPSVTPVVRALMIACGAVWLVQVLLSYQGVPLSRWLGVVPAQVIRGQVWQVATYMFLHDTQSPLHILLNMLMLWMFGSDLERHWGGREFLRYYLISGIGGGVFATVMGLLMAGRGEDQFVTIGASGAVFGLIVAYGTVFADRTVLFMMLFPMRARTMAMILFAITFFYTFSQRASGVSHIGHLGGAVVGYLYLRRVWRIGSLYREVRWRIRRRKFQVLHRDDRGDPDRWVN
jgi:membrane associated rhomboid family serine protease